MHIVAMACCLQLMQQRQSNQACCTLQEKFNWEEHGILDERPIFSYGPCQFPTLGLLVQRQWWAKSSPLSWRNHLCPLLCPALPRNLRTRVHASCDAHQ